MAVVSRSPRPAGTFGCHFCQAWFAAWWMFYEHEIRHPEYVPRVAQAEAPGLNPGPVSVQVRAAANNIGDSV